MADRTQPAAKLDRAEMIDSYRDICEQSAHARSIYDRDLFDGIARRLRDVWKSHVGADTLHYSAFGEGHVEN